MKRLITIPEIFTLLVALGSSGLVSLSHAQQRWTRTYGGTSYDGGWSVQQSSDGGYIIAGFGCFLHNFDVYFVKTNASGDTLWTRIYGGTGNDYGYSVQQTTDGGYIISGQTYSFGAGLSDVYLIKTDVGGSSGVEEGKVVGSRREAVGSITARPNPFATFASVPGHESEHFALYDISGRLVGTDKGDRIGEGLSAGVYFLKSEDNKRVYPLRVLKLR